MLLVSRRPALFRTAMHFHNECGAYQLRAVLNAFSKDALPEELYHSRAHRRRDWSLPWLMPRILGRYNVKAHMRFWFRSSFKERVIAALTRDRPVLFVIHSIRGSGCLHWIGVWGYDETTDEFLCYDSQAPESRNTLGNARYPTPLLLPRLPWRGTFALIIET